MRANVGPANGGRTGEPAPAALDQPRTPATAGRAPRCLRLVVSKRGKNQCESEQAPGYEMCPHHIAEAHRDYEEILAEAARRFAEEFARESGEEAGE